jgi:uncharacterized protein YegP (UPF0339 family)
MSHETAPQTVQTGQAKEWRDPWYEIAEDADGRFHWALWTVNGRVVARSGIAYERKKDAVAAAKLLASQAAKAARIIQVTPD